MNEDTNEIEQDATPRAEWRRPEWRKIDAGQSEAFFNVGPDGGVIS